MQASLPLSFHTFHLPSFVFLCTLQAKYFAFLSFYELLFVYLHLLPSLFLPTLAIRRLYRTCGHNE